jgi:hypothetical protein
VWGINYYDNEVENIVTKCRCISHKDFGFFGVGRINYYDNEVENIVTKCRCISHKTTSVPIINIPT